jgi:hypothetical protein
MQYVPIFPLGIIVLVFIVLAIVASRRRTKAIEVDRTQLFELQNQWRAPSELLSVPVPRPIKLTGQAKVLTVTMVVFLAGVAVFGWFAVNSVVQQQRQRELLGREGIHVTAVIARKWSQSGKSTSYYVTYSYEVGVMIYHRRARIRKSEWEGLQPGSQAAARYAVSDPGVSRLDIEGGGAPDWLVLIPIGVFALVIVFIPLPILRQKKLLATGQPVGGIVTRNSPVKNGRSVSYQFLDSVGNIVSGSAVVPVSGAPEPGAAVPVLYDPEKPSRNTIYPPQLVKLDMPGA